MGIEQKLLQLDEAIFRQYEKVTQKAEEYFGLDKYDLMKGCINSMVAGALGTATYLGIEYASFGEGKSLGLGLAYLGLAGGFHSVLNNDLTKLQQREQEQLESGVGVVPRFNAFRPIGFGILYQCVSDFFESTELVNSLMIATNSFFIFSYFSYTYFENQIPKPPSQSKGKVQEWFGKLGELVGKKDVVDVK